MYLSDARKGTHTNVTLNHTTNGATTAIFTGHQLNNRVIQVRVQ